MNFFKRVRTLLKGPILGIGTIPRDQLIEKYGHNFIDVDGVQIHYLERGDRSKDTLILIHGIYSSLQTWDEWIDKLKDNYHVIAIDIPGFALSGELENYDQATYSNLILNFMKLKSIERATLIGSSLGGLISWSFAVRHPKRVEKLVLVDPGAFPMKAPLIVKLGAIRIFGFINQLMSPRVISYLVLKIFIYGPKGPTIPITERYQDFIRLPGYMKRARRVFKAIIANCKSYPHTISRIKAPTLIMWGEEDHLIPFSHTQLWRKELKSAKIVSYPGIAHLPHEEAPEITYSDLISFLKDENSPGEV